MHKTFKGWMYLDKTKLWNINLRSTIWEIYLPVDNGGAKTMEYIQVLNWGDYQGRERNILWSIIDVNFITLNLSKQENNLFIFLTRSVCCELSLIYLVLLIFPCHPLPHSCIYIMSISKHFWNSGKLRHK